MLVLSRKRNEAIDLTVHPDPSLANSLDPIELELVIVEIRGDKVRIGINAPSNVIVHRREVTLAIKAKEAADANAIKKATGDRTGCDANPASVPC